MAETIITTTPEQDGKYLAQILADFYGLLESDIVDNKDNNFFLNDILTYSKSDLKDNLISIASNNLFESRSNDLISPANGYNNDINTVTISTKISPFTTILVPKFHNLYLINVKKAKLIAEFNNDPTKYQDIASNFFAPYIKELLIEKWQAPFYLPTDFDGAALKNNITLVCVSWRIFVVSKAMNYKVINASPYIIDSNWNDSENGGNFSFTLASPTGEYKNGNWNKINHEVISGYNDLQYRHSDAVTGYRVLNNNVNISPVTTFKNLFFDMVLQKGDIVFIRGERLIKEQHETDIDSKEYCTIAQLVGKNWDLIGMIDVTQTDYQIQNGWIGFNVQGRDLAAINIEEQTVITPTWISDGNAGTYSQNISNYFSNNEQAKTFKSYTRLFGKIQDLAFFTNQPIHVMINWIFDKLAATPFTNDYTLFKEFKNNNPFHSFEEINWNKLKNSGDYERIGIWNLISVWIDESVKDRLVFDSSMATSGGNILSFIKKICQLPFVEFHTMTLGSYFHWIIRRPPFNKKDYKGLYETCNIAGSHNIGAEKIIDLKLDWDSQDIYSVFRLVPMSFQSFLGEQAVNTQFPAILIPELMDRFGAKYFEVASNYALPFVDIEKSLQQATYDLMWLIETMIYKQFSKKGTVTIIGDRIFKKGQAVYLEPLDLLCYVTGVSNQFSISETDVTRVTVLNIERGIRLKHYDKYFQICDFSSVDFSTKINPTKSVSLTKNNNGKPYIYEFFEQRLESDHDHDYSFGKVIIPSNASKMQGF